MFLGIDPSYKRTGLSIIDSKKKLIILGSVSSPIGSLIGSRSFSSVLYHAQCVAEKVVIFLYKWRIEPEKILVEEPFAKGSFSEGLFMLDGILITTLEDVFHPSCCKIYTVNNSALSKIHKTSLRTKLDSRELAKEIIKYMKISLNYDVLIDEKKNLNSDISEGFLYSFYLFLHNTDDGNRMQNEFSDYKNRFNLKINEKKGSIKNGRE